MLITFDPDPLGIPGFDPFFEAEIQLVGPNKIPTSLKGKPIFHIKQGRSEGNNPDLPHVVGVNSLNELPPSLISKIEWLIQSGRKFILRARCTTNPLNGAERGELTIKVKPLDGEGRNMLSFDAGVIENAKYRIEYNFPLKPSTAKKIIHEILAMNEEAKDVIEKFRIQVLKSKRQIIVRDNYPSLPAATGEHEIIFHRTGNILVPPRNIIDTRGYGLWPISDKVKAQLGLDSNSLQRKPIEVWTPEIIEEVNAQIKRITRNTK